MRARSTRRCRTQQEPRVPVLLVQDMNLCYRLLRQLVPAPPPGRAASRVEILQRVIDYILDLQTELDSPAEPQRCDRNQRSEDGSSCQSSDVPRKDRKSWTLLR